MAYVLLYSQDFDAGNSLFSETNFYSLDGTLTPSATGPDPLYPDARFAEGVQVNSGAGPSGVNTLDCWELGNHGAFMGYGNVGIYFNTPNYDDRLTGLTAHRGAAEVWYKPNATSFSENTFCPLLWLLNNEIQKIRLTAYLSGADWVLRLQVPHTFGTTDHDPFYTLGTVASLTDVGKTYRIEWNDGTLECEPEQYIRVLVDGVTVFDQTETADGVDLHPTVATIGGYYLGFSGLFGEATNVRIYADDDCDETPTVDPPPIDASTPCPCPGDGPGPLDAVPNPIGTLPPWIASCEGGCGVDSVADVAVGEVWL